MRNEADDCAELATPCVGQDVVVPYAELLPLLRPVSALTPLLRERGLLPR